MIIISIMNNPCYARHIFIIISLFQLPGVDFFIFTLSWVSVCYVSTNYFCLHQTIEIRVLRGDPSGPFRTPSDPIGVNGPQGPSGTLIYPLDVLVAGRVAEVGGISGSAKYSPRAFLERVFAIFRDKPIRFFSSSFF